MLTIAATATACERPASAKGNSLSRSLDAHRAIFLDLPHVTFVTQDGGSDFILNFVLESFCWRTVVHQFGITTRHDIPDDENCAASWPPFNNSMFF
jgi:hypothetical protein